MTFKVVNIIAKRSPESLECPFVGEDVGRGSAVVPWKEPLAGHRLA